MPRNGCAPWQWYMILKAILLVIIASATFVAPFQIKRITGRQERCSSVIAFGSTESFAYPAADSECFDKELFSVAPMMGHTTRHFFYFFRLLSKHAHLYTEMIPSVQVVRAFQLARAELEGGGHVDPNAVGRPIDPEEIVKVVSGVRDGRHGLTHYGKGLTSLSEMLRFSASSSDSSTDTIRPVILQLGGRDPTTLATAAAIGAAFGYCGVNLNCGCPSNAVSEGDWRRRGGAALMLDPPHVRQCVDEMRGAMDAVLDLGRGESGSAVGECKLSVKHRLGVVDAATYDADADHRKGDDDTIQTCGDFVQVVTESGAVSKFIVHARIGVLGDFRGDSGRGTSSALWVPGREDHSDREGKVNHKREQYKAKKLARIGTRYNRNAPPLRPNVVNVMASMFPDLEFVTNGEMQSLPDVRKRLETPKDYRGAGHSLGAMVGRAVVNHPCAFASVDALWGESRNNSKRPTRGDVLRQYIEYCTLEEKRVLELGAGADTIDMLRKQLVAVPFTLFTGEDGSDKFQRRVRKLALRPVGRGRQNASSILKAAMMEVPSETLENKSVDEHTPLQEVKRYNFVRRSGRLQRSIF